VLAYAAANEQTGGYDQARIRWQRSMRFDDRSGSAEFAGGVRADARVGDGSDYAMEGERLLLTLVSDLMDEQSRKSLRESEQTDALLAVRIEGGADRDAMAEGSRYSIAADSGARVLETAARLSGGEILAQRDTQRITVPGAGRLVFEDRRENEDGGSESDGVPTDGRGTTVFDWTGSLVAEEAEGRAVMSRDVRMRHRHLGSDTLTVVETERLTATVQNVDAEDGTAYVLDEVEAEGAVLATHGESQVVADQLRYNRVASRVIASALPGNRVTFFDAESGRHLPAERVILDLLTGRWRIEQAGQITTPLGNPG
jgi:hypothetical protein